VHRVFRKSKRLVVYIVKKKGVYTTYVKGFHFRSRLQRTCSGRFILELNLAAPQQISTL